VIPCSLRAAEALVDFWLVDFWGYPRRRFFWGNFCAGRSHTGVAGFNGVNRLLLTRKESGIWLCSKTGEVMLHYEIFIRNQFVIFLPFYRL
jgi:hypothetical protein